MVFFFDMMFGLKLSFSVYLAANLRFFDKIPLKIWRIFGYKNKQEEPAGKYDQKAIHLDRARPQGLPWKASGHYADFNVKSPGFKLIAYRII